MERSSFGGTAGLSDDFDFTITSAQFGYDSEYMDGKALCMIIEGSNEDEGTEERLLLSTGTGWEDADKGARAVLEKTGEPKESGFNRSCRYQQFLVQACKVGAEEVLAERGESYEAAIWDGLRFHMMRGAIVSGEFEAGVLPKNPVSGEEKQAGDLYPSEFLGEGKAAKKATGTAKKAAGAKKKTAAELKAKAAKAKAADADDDPIMVSLKELANEVGVDEHDTFIERAMDEIEGVADDDDIQAKIVDEDFFASLID